MQLRVWWCLISLVVLTTGGQAWAHEAKAAQPTINVGIVPQQSASRLAKLWTPILNYLSEKTGYQLKFKTAQNIPTFEKRVLAGEYDLAYMNPYHYTVFHQKPGYRAIARQADKRIRGILVVRKGSAVDSLQALNGRDLAFPSPAAFAASVLPRAELEKQGVEFTPHYVSSHDSVYLGVAKGLFLAGGGIQRTFNNMAPEVKNQLRVLWTTAGYTPHAFAVSPRMSAEVANKLQAAMVAMAKDPKGRELLATIGFKAIEVAQDSDWNDVRALHIHLLDHLLQE